PFDNRVVTPARVPTLVAIRRVVLLLVVPLAFAAYAAADGFQQASDPPAYRNPVYSSDAPDPSVVRIGPEYWAMTTAVTGEGSPPILRSPDLVHWTQAGSLFDQAPAWTDGTRFWAPEMFRQGDEYLAYY